MPARNSLDLISPITEVLYEVLYEVFYLMEKIAPYLASMSP
jgi:hypothetical protein